MSGLIVSIINFLAGFWKKPPVLAVLVINLIPAVCVLFFGWSALALLLLYWAENVIIGVINALKMAVVSFSGGVASSLLGLFMIPFFIIHYGGFCAGHGFFTLMIVGGGLTHGDPVAEATDIWRDRWNYVAPLLAMTAFHLAALVQWLRARAFRATTVDKQMGEPYGRILIMHFTILVGAVLIVVTGQSAAAVALLAVLKTLFEVFHTAKRLDEHGKPVAEPKPSFP